MDTKSNNKTIAKNTLLLYVRMFLTMFIALYTSRIILENLGVEDYGIYQAVGGIVGFLSFINGALATGSSRFITYSLGQANKEELKRTFSTTLLVHIVIAAFIAIIAESFGLCFFYNNMVIPEARLAAASWTYHISILTAVFTLLQVPFNATIIAHEKMSVYAYVSIFDAIAKLAICYLLSLGNIDRLILYSALLCAIQLGILAFYWLYCHRVFLEVCLKIVFDKKIFKEIAGFSGWSLFANAAIALNNQGVLILLNMFFSPAIVAARAISLQVNSAANQFVINFRQAVNPQIVKRYASGDKDGSKQLLLDSTKFSYFLMLALSLPICLQSETILKLWLKIVPDYSVPFLQIVIVQSLFQVIDTSLYTALYTKGRLRENALISPTLLFILFPIVYFMFRIGFSPLVLSWGSLIVYMLLSVIIKPVLLVKIADYSYYDLYEVFRSCFIVTTLSLPLPLLCNYAFSIPIILKLLLVFIVTLVNLGVVVYYVGLTKENRLYLRNILINKFVRKKSQI